MSYATICAGWLSILHEVLIYMSDNAFLRAVFSLTLVVCLYRYVMCVRLEHVLLEGRTAKERVADYIHTHVTCLELGFASWESELSKVLSVYIGNHVTWPAPKQKICFVRDKIKFTDVVGNTGHVIFLSNMSPKLINLLTSATFFFREQVNQGSCFSRIFWRHTVINGHLRYIGVEIL